MFEYNYKFGETVDVQKEFGVTKISDNKYVGVKPLIKPSPQSRGAFGGNLVGQALLVAIRSCPEGFRLIHYILISSVLLMWRPQWNGKLKLFLMGNHLATELLRGSKKVLWCIWQIFL